MPNWCYNNISFSLTAKKENSKEVKAFLEELVQSCTEGRLNEFISPLGQEWHYGLAVEKWGTKWDVDDIDSVLEEDNRKDEIDFMVYLIYNTAWGPNIKVSEKLYEKLNGMGSLSYEHKYNEPGAAFYGIYNGIQDKSYDMTIAYMIVEDEIQCFDLNSNENNIMTFKGLDGFFLIKNKVDFQDSIYDDTVSLTRYDCFSETYGENIQVYSYCGDFYIPDIY